MAYTRTNWVSGETPLSAENMNNIEDGIEEAKEAVNDLNSKGYADWTSYLSSTEKEDYANCIGMYKNDVVTVSIRTKTRVHVENDIIMTIPDGYRPPAAFHAIAKSGSNDICVLNISANGQVSIWSIPSNNATGRLVACFTYIKA